ncbi:MAG: tetratricopeptide repeat protein [Planctomycetota bacterium]|jgi:tetratricopeptide (TPR) repeat protein|nr:tetratricopeptide repeat protein [Planctomycetota bacterium]MDP7250850.1 tetratricopeptide repeat protein [Planctomycetota bacterium]
MDANKLFDRAMQASERGNHDYAIELFQQLLIVQPENTQARKELRNVERRKMQEDGGRNSVVATLAYFKSLGAVVGSTIGNSEKRMIACERFLKNDPDSRPMLAKLARSSEQSGYTKTAILVYEDVKSMYPDDVESIRRLARLYQDAGSIDQASDCFQLILNKKPQDEEAGKAVKDLAALKTMKEGNWEQAGKEGAYRQMLKDEGKSVELEQEQHIVRTEDEMARKIERVKADLEKDPKNVKILMQLADSYTRAGQLQNSRNTYLQVKDIDSRNKQVDRLLADLDIQEKKDNISKLAAQLEKDPNDQKLKVQLDHENKALQELELGLLQNLVENNPTDMGLKYKLGYALTREGDLDGAIGQFQQSAFDPKVRRDSNRMLGECFMGKKIFDMAVDFYDKALEESSGSTNEGKDIIYNLGLCYESQGDRAKALEAFKRIMMVDISFRDVAQKVESLSGDAA